MPSPYVTNNSFSSLNSVSSSRIVPSRFNDSYANIREAVDGSLESTVFPLANPRFDYGSSGMYLHTIKSVSPSGVASPARIIRGHIRRSVVDNADPTSKFRLYFMYNPEVIERTYVSYLEQAALDPFNTVFGSNNLVAPPGVLDFSFEMFFDRQTENANGSMPRGVLEDFDYFDLVVRGVVPGYGTGDLPDNGVLMVNPRNITVVFSPQLTVQGRPHSAEVLYQKFDHKMNPVRMTIRLTMKAQYIGAMRRDFSFAQTQQVGTYQATVPYDERVKYSLSYETLSVTGGAAFVPSVPTAPSGITTGSGTPPEIPPYSQPFITPVSSPIGISTEIVPNNNVGRPPILRPNSAVYSNGYLPVSLLAPIIGRSPNASQNPFHLWHPAQSAFMSMYWTAAGQGIYMSLIDGYRTYDEQVTIYHRSGGDGSAATPGKSNHGWGIAVDFERLSDTWDATYAWLSANAYKWNFYQLLDPWEPWHWDWCAGNVVFPADITSA